MSQNIKERLRNAPLWNCSTLHAEAADHIEALERQLAKLDESNLSLDRQLAAAQLDAKTAWGRYENANSSRITTERQLADLRQAERQALEGWKLVPDWKVGMRAKFRGIEYKIFARGDVPGTFDICLPDNTGDRWINVSPDAFSPMGAAPSAEQAKPDDDSFATAGKDRP